MTFIEELERDNRAHLDRIDAVRDEAALVLDKAEMVKRLKLALRQELEATEIAALWLPSTRSVEIKLALAKMCGDEGKHYRLIANRLAELGEDVSGLDPFAQGRSGFYDFLAGLTDDVERVAAACFTREAIGHVRNEQFIGYCEKSGDTETARMYREDIQPDEWSHVVAGRALLEKHAVDAASQEKARAAARKTLTLAEGAVEAIVHKMGMSCAPGC